ncbi:retinal degeneration C isoform 1-T6 [Glossina fuscipes fuscipes]
MLRNCVCFGQRSQNKRRSSSFDTSSSCRSSEIERSGKAAATRATVAATVENHSNTMANGGMASSLLQLFQKKGWYRHWRKPTRGITMSKTEITIKAAILIQRWYRRHQARMEIKRRYTWEIFTTLEYAGEQDQVELYNFFNALLTHIPSAAAEASGERRSSILVSPARLTEDSDYKEEYDRSGNKYGGPEITSPISGKDVDALIEAFRRKKSSHLHPKYVALILREAASRLKNLPNLHNASTAISKQITICGDLHGKLDDLLVIFYKNGLPSPENPYIFNGDFVDRGKKGLEVFLILLACYLAFPHSVYLNRGNHEDSVMNARYGFIREVETKYQNNSERILKLIDEVYRWLPLGSVIDDSVLVVHGGISDQTDLNIIKKLDRSKYISILRPPVESRTTLEEDTKLEWQQVFDMMWSDPQHIDGCVPNVLRGAGTYFGPDVTSQFLKKHKLQLLVRSHECKVDGYEFNHNDLLVTIFSASNYYAIGSNRGAYMKLNFKLEPHFVQFISAASKTRELSIRQRVGIVETSALRGLGARLRAKRLDLELEFQKHDPHNTGIITISEWCEAMEKATHLGLSWRLLRPRLAPSSPNQAESEVNYLVTLQLLDTDTMIKAEELETSVADSLYKNVSSLEAIFHIIDADHSGFISLSEFTAAIDLLEQHLPGVNQREHLLRMCRLMDLNNDGAVDLNEFLEAFRLAEQARNKKGPIGSVTDRRIGGEDIENLSPNISLKASSATAAAIADELQEMVFNDVENDIDPSDCETQNG